MSSKVLRNSLEIRSIEDVAAQPRSFRESANCSGPLLFPHEAPIFCSTRAASIRRPDWRLVSTFRPLDFGQNEVGAADNFGAAVEDIASHSDFKGWEQAPWLACASVP